MTTITTHAPGTFCWPELATSDPAGAKRFYGELFGWEGLDEDMGEGRVYTLLQKDGRNVGALYALRREMKEQGVPSHWLQYVAVESADDAAAKAKQLGGVVVVAPFDVHDLGRMAVIQDPTGATFAIWQAGKSPGAHVLNQPGALTWDELVTSDVEKAKAFYTGILPWQAETMSMPDFDYTVFKRGDTPAAGMMAIQADWGPMPSNWNVYFQVEDADAAAAKAVGLGAEMMMPPADVPNVGRFAILRDPQGAVFAFIAYPKQG